MTSTEYTQVATETKLNMGAYVLDSKLASNGGEFIVLAKWERSSHTSYVTWRVSFDLSIACLGHYHETIEAALEDYKMRD